MIKASAIFRDTNFFHLTSFFTAFFAVGIVLFSSYLPNKDYYFDRMVVLVFCFMGFIGSFFGTFLKNRLAEQLKNAIADNFPRWRFFVANNISLDLWVIVIFVGIIVGFVGISLSLWG